MTRHTLTVNMPDADDTPVWVCSVLVAAPTEELALTVLSERFDYDEEYDDPATGEPFRYSIGRPQILGVQR